MGLGADIDILREDPVFAAWLLLMIVAIGLIFYTLYIRSTERRELRDMEPQAVRICMNQDSFANCLEDESLRLMWQKRLGE